MNRSDLQTIADVRVGDAEILLAGGRFDGAYYLLGYAVECALKSCIAKQIQQFEFPDKKLVNDSYVHDLAKLLVTSGIKQAHEAERKSNGAFETNWAVVKDWSEERRYQHSITEEVARDFFDAVTDHKRSAHMAEEALVKEFLTEIMVRGGEALTRKLDELGWPVVASFWYFEPDDNRWKLMIASPKVNLDGPKKAYEAIRGALMTLQDHFTDLQYITVVQPDHPIVRTLAAAIPTGPAIVGIRFSQHTIKGRFIDDAYLYRVNPSPVAA